MADNRKQLAKFNGDQARIERLMRSAPGPTARRFFDELRVAPLVAREPRTVTVRKPRPLDHPFMYDQDAVSCSRIPERLQLAVSLLCRNVEAPGTVSADALLAAVAAVHDYDADDCPVHGIPRPGGAA
jgi:hypothetical protein